jgi:hypothetical protein
MKEAMRRVVVEARRTTWEQREPDLLIGRRQTDRDRRAGERRHGERREGDRRQANRESP